MSIPLSIIIIGIVATFAVDIWTMILNLFKIKSLDYRYVGRWAVGFPKGKFFHKNIMEAEPAHGELLIGWASHYLIGITFSFFLFILFGEAWLDEPAVLPALLTGIITAAAPLFIMQPAFGFGIGSAKLPNPNLRRLKTLMTHIIYGLGLYLAALLVKYLLG